MFVNAAAAKRLHGFLQDARNNSKPGIITAGFSKFLDLPAGTPTRYRDVDEDETTDGAAHGFQLIIGTTTQINAVIFRVSRMLNAVTSESYFLTVDTKGTLQHVARAYVKYDGDKVIRGSGSSQVLEPTAPPVPEKLQHELDFWLKGMYRKTKSNKK